MERLFTSVREFISPEILSKISESMGGDKSRALFSVNSIMATSFELILENGDKRKIERYLKGLGSLSILLNVHKLFSEDLSLNKQTAIKRFLAYLLKDKYESFYHIISSNYNIGGYNVKKTADKVVLLVAAFLGEKLISGIKFSNLLEQLSDERISFQQYIPYQMREIIEKSNSKAFLIQKFWTSLF